MITKEVKELVKKLDTIKDWFNESTGREYEVSNLRALDLLIELEEVKVQDKETIKDIDIE